MQFIYNGNSRKSGVYKITNTTNGKVYIGSARKFRERSGNHLISLEKGLHWNKHLQYAFNKDGTSAFVFEVLEVVDGDKLSRTIVEQSYLDAYLENWNQCYNFMKSAVSVEKACWSSTPEETRLKLSKAATAQWQVPGFRQEFLRVRKEKMKDPDYRENSSKAAKVRWQDPEYRKKLVGRKCPEETKKKISEAHKKNWQDPEYRKMATGRKHTQETKDKISWSHLKKHSKTDAV